MYETERRLADLVGNPREPLLTVPPVFSDDPETIQERADRLREKVNSEVLKEIFGELPNEHYAFAEYHSRLLGALDPSALSVLLAAREFSQLSDVDLSESIYADSYRSLLSVLRLPTWVNPSDLDPRKSKFRRPGIVVTAQEGKNWLDSTVHFGHLQHLKDNHEGLAAGTWVLATCEGPQALSPATFVKPLERKVR